MNLRRWAGILCGMVWLSGGAQAQTAGALPAAWLDSLAANSWKMEGMSHITGYRLMEVKEELASDGTRKDADTTYFRVTVGADGKEQKTEYDAAGNAKPSKPAKKGEKTVTVEQSLPLTLFDGESQKQYRYQEIGGEWGARRRIAFESAPGAEAGYHGTAVIDTPAWTMARLTCVPKTMPEKHLREFTMDMQFEPDSRGYMLMSRAVVTGKGKYLVFRFNMRVTQLYSDYTFEPHP
jgi:hypothetical protein